jgi:hypothetical protein
MNVATNMTEDSKLDTPDDSVGGSADNEQGTQTSPEPNTGDDANPDSVTPDGE